MIGKLYNLVNFDLIVYIVKEEYSKGIGKIKQNLRSGNPFVSRSSVSQGVVNDCNWTKLIQTGYSRLGSGYITGFNQSQL